MYAGDFWPLGATHVKLLDGCCKIPHIENIVFPQSGLFLTPSQSIKMVLCIVSIFLERDMKFAQIEPSHTFAPAQHEGASERGSPLPKLGGRLFDRWMQRPPPSPTGGTAHLRYDAWNVRVGSLWWAQLSEPNKLGGGLGNRLEGPPHAHLPTRPPACKHAHLPARLPAYPPPCPPAQSAHTCIPACRHACPRARPSACDNPSACWCHHHGFGGPGFIWHNMLCPGARGCGGLLYIVQRLSDTTLAMGGPSTHRTNAFSHSLQGPHRTLVLQPDASLFSRKRLLQRCISHCLLQQRLP